MNKKRLLSPLVSVLLAASLLTSCGHTNGTNTAGTTTEQSTEATESTSSTQTQKPTVTPQDFAEQLQNAVSGEVQSHTVFEIREKHQAIPSSFMKKTFQVKWISDFSDSENPQFFYSAQKSSSAEESDTLLFYDNGILYIKDAEGKYRQNTPLDQAIGKISHNVLSEILGDEITEIFSNASVTGNTDGSRSASVDLPFETYADAVTSYLSGLGIRSSGNAYETDGKPSPLTVSVTLSGKGNILSYSLKTVMQAPQQSNPYPITYTVSAVCNEIGEDFSVPLPDPEERESYMEVEPEIEGITAEEFLRRFEKSDEMSGRALYTELTTNASATYVLSDGTSATVPIFEITALDLSNPSAPKVAIVKIKEMLGTISKTEIYYKDDIHYYAIDGYRVCKPYPAEEYLANVESAAKEKEENGISSIFLTEDMMQSAVLTVNSDQSVHALIRFDGNTQEKNIAYHISSVFNDDFSKMKDVTILDTTVSITLDRFNYMTSYNLSVTVSTESNGESVIATYTVNRSYEYDETPRAINFPDDLDTWASIQQGGEIIV